MFRVSVVLLSVLCVVYAAPQFEEFPNTEKFSKEQGCFIDDLDKFIPFGQSAPANSSCMEYTCHEENFISAKTCPSEYALPPYELFEDKTKLYPDCCPYYKIPE